MNDTDRTEGADTTPEAAPQDGSSAQPGAAEPPAIEQAPSPQPSDAPPAGGPFPPPGGPTAQPMPARMLESEARNWAMLIHIIAAAAALLSLGTVSWVVPLVLWLIYRERSALIEHHGKQNLNLQLTLLVVMVGGVIIGFATLFIGFFVTIPAMILYGLYSIVISFVAGVKANHGEYYRISLIIPFLR
ncbi:DUF4870 domain-containing protein [Demequina capsici]|uniref:DUF4870 domain-containing protein n=1 Tax=Demequina capsici TaxID=3075620 RepID=A0AA96F7F4_9MICO|nr:DUF4870 domain-containing protein [Demequina sp. OYTSA14]WNM25476.1 DUF4870 domain-containing protein [Demequina sp. OYTSA14]